MDSNAVPLKRCERCGQPAPAWLWAEGVLCADCLEGRCVRCGAESAGLAGHNLKLCDRCWELRDIRTQARAAAGNRVWGRADHRAHRQLTWWTPILVVAIVQLIAVAVYLQAVGA